MLFRLTQKMAKKIKESPSMTCSVLGSPYTDWSAHLFTAERAQYIMVTHSTSLYSIILHGRGITDASLFIKYTLEFMAEYMCQDGFEFQFRRLIVPDAAETLFAKLSDRRIMGSMNDMIRIAKLHLIEGQVSPFEAAEKINTMPMSYLDYDHPKRAFGAIKLDELSD